MRGMEMIDEKMQAGYRKLREDDCADACRIWIEVWKAILSVMDSNGIETLNEFDEKFSGKEHVGVWAYDFERELANAGCRDKKFLNDRIWFCEEFIRRSPDEDEDNIREMKRAVAESRFQLGETDKAEKMFEELLREDPRWGWGWIAWSDCYWLRDDDIRNPEKAEELLKQGLAVPRVKDKQPMLERLADIYTDTGRKKDAKKIREQIASDDFPEEFFGEDGDDIGDEGEECLEICGDGNVLRLKTILDFGKRGIPLDNHLPETEKTKVGRNDPCSCGSGKKFKKCCGR